MSKFTKELINDYSNKLLIGLTEEENELVLSEFEVIEKNMNLINEIPNIENVEPMTHPFDLYETSLREDIDSDSEDIEDILKNCDKKIDREIKVPRVVEE
jgi:aspartyl/glutamyl-tRNA(Asn/Gln) amidotransferase C subunit